MPVSMPRFGWEARSGDSSATGELKAPTFPFRTECRGCNFEPTDPIGPLTSCPKCGGNAWERYVVPRSLLMYADQTALAIEMKFKSSIGAMCPDA